MLRILNTRKLFSELPEWFGYAHFMHLVKNDQWCSVFYYVPFHLQEMYSATTILDGGHFILQSCQLVISKSGISVFNLEYRGLGRRPTGECTFSAVGMVSCTLNRSFWGGEDMTPKGGKVILKFSSLVDSISHAASSLSMPVTYLRRYRASAMITQKIQSV